MLSKLLTFITGRLNPLIIESTHARPQSIKQARRPEFYKYTRLPVIRWVKLSLNLTKFGTKLAELKFDPIY